MSRAAVWIANGALLVLCCFLVARMATEIAAQAFSPPPAAENGVSPEAASTPGDSDGRRIILDRNLFRVSTRAPALAAPAPEEETYEKTKLRLKLLGTAASDEPALSWAAVEDLQARVNVVVGVNDTLQGKAEVVRIEPRRIVLRNSGRLEELALDEDDDREPRRAERRGARRRSGRSAARSAPARAQRDAGQIRQRAENRFSVPREEARELARNPATLFSQARILPKYDAGKMVGVQLNAIKAGSVFEEIGIRDGDTITEFNGIEVSSQQQSAALLRELTEASSLDIRVMDAKGNVRELRYELE